MKSNAHYNFKSVEQANSGAYYALEMQDRELCKQAVIYLFNHLTASEFDARIMPCKDFLTSCVWLEMLHCAGCDKFPEGSFERNMYLKIFDYFIENMPPDVQKSMNNKLRELYPNVKPVGYTENGVACYSAADVAEALGEDPYELAARLPDNYTIPEDKVIKIQ